MCVKSLEGDNDKIQLRSPRIRIGIDIVEVKRFKQRRVQTNLSFYNSVFTESELKHCLKYSNPYPHLAGIFAAKEACIKCLDTSLSLKDIEITYDMRGKPSAVTMLKKKAVKIKVSISHTASTAIAVAILTP
jgi:holo-[acyl-carrier protein] synthase